MQAAAEDSAEYAAALAEFAPYEELARMVIRSRAKRGYSQKALADLVGTSTSAIARLESGHHRPSVETLRKVAHALNFDLVIGFSAPRGSSEREVGHPPDLVHV